MEVAAEHAHCLEDQKAALATAADEAAAAALANLEAKEKKAADALAAAEKQSQANIDSLNARIAHFQVFKSR